MSFAEDKLRWHGWKIDILGTDVSRSAIERARAGIYSQFEVQRGLPVLQMLRWFKEAEGQQWRIVPELHGAVRFQNHSLQSRRRAPARSTSFCAATSSSISRPRRAGRRSRSLPSQAQPTGR
jgi:chemotaxis protein methyltransferase CheR